MLVDSNLPVERDRLKNRLIRLVKEDNDILGCFFGGSIGTKTEDFYSDIDARIIVKSSINIKRKQVEIIRAIGKYLFIEKIADNYSIINYDTFIQLDLHIYTKHELVPCEWLKNILIVKDFGYIEELTKLSQDVTYRITQNEFDQLVYRYYGDYFELYRCWKRNEENYIESLTLSIKHTLISFWYIAKGFKPNQSGEWGKYEGKKTKLSLLETNFILSFTPLELCNLEAFTKKVEILMLETIEKIANYNNLTFSVETFKQVHQRVSFKQDDNEVD